jgi:hypothetical protein
MKSNYSLLCGPFVSRFWNLLNCDFFLTKRWIFLLKEGITYGKTRVCWHYNCIRKYVSCLSYWILKIMKEFLKHLSNYKVRLVSELFVTVSISSFHKSFEGTPCARLCFRPQQNKIEKMLPSWSSPSHSFNARRQ